MMGHAYQQAEKVDERTVRSGLVIIAQTLLRRANCVKNGLPPLRV